MFHFSHFFAFLSNPFPVTLNESGHLVTEFEFCIHVAEPVESIGVPGPPRTDDDNIDDSDVVSEDEAAERIPRNCAAPPDTGVDDSLANWFQKGPRLRGTFHSFDDLFCFIDSFRQRFINFLCVYDALRFLIPL